MSVLGIKFLNLVLKLETWHVPESSYFLLQSNPLIHSLSPLFIFKGGTRVGPNTLATLHRHTRHIRISIQQNALTSNLFSTIVRMVRGIRLVVVDSQAIKNYFTLTLVKFYSCPLLCHRGPWDMKPSGTISNLEASGLLLIHPILKN